MTKLTTNVLMTGGTGFIGKAVLARLLDASAYEKIYLLVRGTDDETAANRVESMLEKMFPSGRQNEVQARVKAVEGDLRSPGLGISDRDFLALKGAGLQVLHIGASTDFGAPLDVSRRTNVEGTRYALDFAVRLSDAGALRRFDYVSTAYVAGAKAGIVTEGDLVRGQDFANNYEQSKYEAELLVKSYCARLPIAVYRPSIVVGDSRHGFTPHFKVLYWPLLLLSKNLLPFFACNQNARLDVVPVDFVADALVALMQDPASVGDTLQLTAGFDKEVRIRQLLRDSYRYAGIKRRPIIPTWLFRLIQRSPLRRLVPASFWSAVELATPYFRYLNGTGVRFNSERTLAKLSALGVSCPAWENYKQSVLGYCTASRWGRRVPQPEFNYYLTATGRKSGRLVNNAIKNKFNSSQILTNQN